MDFELTGEIGSTACCGWAARGVGEGVEEGVMLRAAVCECVPMSMFI